MGQKIRFIEAYVRANRLFMDYTGDDFVFFGAILVLDLSTVVPLVSIPKRPHDRVSVSNLKFEFKSGLTVPVNFKRCVCRTRGQKPQTYSNTKARVTRYPKVQW